MDRRTWILVALCLALFLAYPHILRVLGLGDYMTPSTPAPPDTSRVVVTQSPAPSPVASPPPAAAAAPATMPTDTTARAPERIIVVDHALYRASFSSHGARLVGVELKRYASAHGASARKQGARLRRGEVVPENERVELAGGPALRLALGSGASVRALDALAYEAAESLDASGAVRTLSFTARDPDGAVFRQVYRMRPDDYAMDLEVEIRNVPAGWRLSDYSITARSWPLAHEHDPLDEERSLRATGLVGTNLHREGAGGLKKGPKTFEGNAAWASVQTRYFVGCVALSRGTSKGTVASLESRALSAEELARLGSQAKPVQDLVTHALVMSLPGESEAPHRFLVYFGPNEYFRLAKVGHGLERIVDLGWSWIQPFSKLLLQLMLWLYGLVRNYGIAIVLLATLVRVLLHPLSMISIKSMREMQKVQPEIERLREKYKKDPQAMNQAMMALYRDHKINPAGGCLPMLVQMPLFFALYSVLFNAIELRQAPFVGWVSDLSAPDVLFEVGSFPIRILPLLMTGSGLLQQKMTPTDPRQATSMYLMNVLMLVFFYNLPSGLVLYWTVMNVLTALQQWIALREDGGHPAPVSAVAGRRGAK
jgi:YidC/Oxa1 family membrane protein insertase